MPNHFEFYNDLEFYNGTGNTFYFLNLNRHALPESTCTQCGVNSVSSLRQFAKTVCAHTKAADGLVLYRCDADFLEMTILNSDGSFAGTCGNALRCLGLALLRQKKWTGHQPLAVRRLLLPYFKDENALTADEQFMSQPDVFANLLQASLQQNSTDKAHVAVDMGAVKNFRPIDFQKTSENLTDEVTASFFVELANPHWVFVMNGPLHRTWSAEDYKRFGTMAQTLWRHTYQLPVTNIGMLWPQPATSKLPTKLVVYERGAGLTQCCGSGACAAAAVLQSLHPEQRQFHFQMPGGDVSVTIGSTAPQSLTLSGLVAFEKN